MKKGLLIIFAILSLILCLGLASCGGNDNPGTENGGNTENSGSVEDSGNTENSGNTEGGGNVEDNKNYVTITFDTKGGSVLDSVQVEKGGKIPKPQDPTKEGYTFNNWSVDGTEWVFIGYVATEDMTLEASWTPTTYTIEYIGQVNHTNKTTYTVEDEFDLEGRAKGVYIFQGWYLDEDFTKPITKIEKGTTGNLKLYGKTKDSGLKVELKGYEYAVVGCDKDVTSVVIPETCNGLRITSIGATAFYGCTGLTSVEIPNSVTTIGTSAFSGCTGLTSVTIGDSVTTIGNGAFYGCTGLEEITLPFVGNGSGKTHFGYIFGASSYSYNDDCVPTSLKKVTITGGASIREHAFYNCTSLTSIEIPNSVTEIGNSAFYGCTGLARVDISDIGAWCNISFGNYTSSPLYYAKNLYLNGELVTDLVIPNNATSIGNYTFWNCTSLKSIVIPNRVTTIGDRAFSGCTGLISVTIGDSVTTIGSSAFYGCTGLTSVTIPSSVTSIGDYAFEDCTGLTRVDISDIGAWCNISFGNSYANPLYYAKNLYLNGVLVTDLVIPNSVTSIGDYAFRDCTGLTSVTIPNSVTTIGYEAIYGSTDLIIYCEAESKPNGWNSSWNYSGCPVVWNCKNNDIADDERIYIVEEGIRYYIDTFTDGVTFAKQIAPIVTANIKEKISYKGNEYTVTTIGDSAFSGCTGLTSVTIPNSVTWIGFYAFSGCTSLTSVTIPNGVTRIWSGAFSGCTGLTSITIGGSVTAIDSSAFSGCTSLTSVTIPSSVTRIGGAFPMCTSLTSITVDNENPNYKSVNGNIYTKDGKTLVQYAPGKRDTSFVIPSGVTAIGYSAFEGCTWLTSVEIPNSVTSIGANAFLACTRLTSVTIPNSVTSIGKYAFENCTGLTSIVIPNSVTSIGEYAFENCTGLTSIVIPNSVTSIGNYAFLYCTGLTSIVIPNSVNTIGWNAFSGCTGLTIYCEAESKPSSWSSWWNPSNCPVVWGHKMQSED